MMLCHYTIYIFLGRLIENVSIMGIIKGGIEFTGKVGNLVAYKRNGKIVVQSKGGASKEKILTDPAMAGTKNNALAFGNAVKVGCNIRKGIDFRNCAPKEIHSKLQGFLFGQVVRKDTLNSSKIQRVQSENLRVLDGYKFNDKISSTLDFDMMRAEWVKTDSGTSMRLDLPDFSELKSNFNGFKIWGGIRVISLVEKEVYDSYEAETDLFDIGSSGEVAFEFPELNMADNQGELLNPDDIAVVYHWGFSSFIDGYTLFNKAMNGIYMRVG